MSPDSNVIALFIETPGQWQEHNLAPIQADLILRRLRELSVELKELNISMIFERCDSFSNCADFISSLCQKHHINRLWANKEYELNEVKRDELVAETLTNVGVESRFIDDSCMFSPGEVLNQQGSYFKVFTPFKKAWLSKFASRPVPVSKPPRLEHNALTIQSELSFNYPLKDSSAYPISTKEIITKLREFAADKASDYSEDRDFPAIEGTSKLSPYLAIGALSVRQCLARLF
ncbi:deoxyribodipyrimidine photolyase [Vibrio ishigakensis]|uniref:Deoxyribodipyrimidine photolyase n=1 Tax=Vibrio ishigakensis TaxID=1481914 RepID=A0A0B8PJG9_9VIBR|nr:deoxyribodipyrimidine photolyase [Vibrio ishigakensis]